MRRQTHTHPQAGDCTVDAMCLPWGSLMGGPTLPPSIGPPTLYARNDDHAGASLPSHQESMNCSLSKPTAGQCIPTSQAAQRAPHAPANKSRPGKARSSHHTPPHKERTNDIPHDTHTQMHSAHETQCRKAAQTHRMHARYHTRCSRQPAPAARRYGRASLHQPDVPPDDRRG